MQPKVRVKPVTTLLIDSNEAQDDRNEILMHYLAKHFGSGNVIVQSLPTDFAFDIGERRRLGERKVTPTDLLASITDGRLKNQAIELAACGGFLLLEGSIKYNREGWVMDGGRMRGFTVKQLTGIFMSLEQSGVKIVWSDGPMMTPLVLDEVHHWYSKDSSVGFVDGRPRPRWEWGMPSMREKILWAFAGFGMGPKTALAAWKTSQTLRKFLAMDEKEMQKIPGMGPGRARKVHEILDKEMTNGHSSEDSDDQGDS